MFDHCVTIDHLKSAYRELAIKHHPDKGGNVETMKAINLAYEDAFRRIKAGEGVSESQINDEWEIEEIFIEKIDAIADLDGITIEIVGRWLWLTGNTFPVKNRIKEAGYFWARKKKAWYWRPDDAKTRNRKEITLDQIRDKYGSRVIHRPVNALN